MTESTVVDSSTELLLSGALPGGRSLSFNSFSSSAAVAAASFAHTTPRRSAVPFSWERRPGIPKSPKTASAAAGGGERLPLPPLFRSHSELSSRYGRYRSHGRLQLPAVDDPFAVALRNCARGLAVAGDEGEEMRYVWDKAENTRRRRGTIAGRFGYGLSRFYSSCMAASSVTTAAAAAAVRRVHGAGSVRGPVELGGINLPRAASIIPGRS